MMYFARRRDLYLCFLATFPSSILCVSTQISPFAFWSPSFVGLEALVLYWSASSLWGSLPVCFRYTSSSFCRSPRTSTLGFWSLSHAELEALVLYWSVSSLWGILPVCFRYRVPFVVRPGSLPLLCGRVPHAGLEALVLYWCASSVLGGVCPLFGHHVCFVVRHGSPSPFVLLFNPLSCLLCCPTRTLPLLFGRSPMSDYRLW